MRITEKNKSGLERYKPGNGYDLSGQDDALSEAMDLLYEVMNESYATSGTPLAVDVNGNQESIQGLFWKCKELLDQVGRDYEKTGFLAMSVLEWTWGYARPLCLCDLDKMLDGDMSMLENAKRLEAILADNPYKKIWAEKSALYAAILEKIGFDADPGAFKDLTKIMDPLLDALSFYGGDRRRSTDIYQIRAGKPSESRNPLIARAMCRYSSVKELVDAVMSSGHDSLLAFGAVSQTHAQVTDYFEAWYYGHPGERQRNLMKYDNLTPEQYMAMECDYTRRVYLCVKSGSACWLVPMHWRGDGYTRIGDKDHAYYYGKRASYAPYQIFYDEAPPAPEGSSMLAIPKTSWLLSDLMDEMSMAWYPAFLDETMKTFFRGTVPEATELLMPEEIAAEMPEEYKARTENPERSYAVVPVVSGVPALCSWAYEIQPPESFFADRPYMLELFRHFGITPADIKNIPILPETAGTRDKCSGEARSRNRKAYLRILALKIADLMESRWDARAWTLKQLSANEDRIVQMAGDGDLMAFMSVTIDGTPVRNPDGTVKMVKRGRYPWDEIPDKTATSPDDAREHRDLTRNFAHKVIWASAPTASRPPVVWKLVPETAEQYALLCGTDVASLPEILRLAEPLLKFNKDFKNEIPSDLGCEWIARGYGDLKANRSAYMPCFALVNICMTKKAYKAFPYFAGNGGKKK